jgi:metal-dependent amidase/aminoacylase/carboxypeptidase family protein
MEGTVRCLNPDDRALMEGRVRRVVEDTASAFGATADAELDTGYPVTVNHEDATDWAVEAARAVANDVDDTTDPIMPSEDFSYMLNERPGAYLFLGNGDSAMCHHPKYNFNDEAIPYGCSFFAEIVERRMPAR